LRDLELFPVSREKLALHWRSFYRGFVEVFADSRPASIARDGALARVTLAVQPQLDEVEARIARQAAAFDPAIEGYVTYAIGSRGKRLRPLMALLSGGATGGVTAGHVDLAVIVELIHIATLVHDDIMDEAERRRAQPTVNARWGNSLSVLLGDCLFAQALNLSTNFDNREISRVIARAAREVCSGEIIQTQRRFDLHLAINDYLRIVEMKTGSLFAAAAELGAVLNDADLETTRALKNFGSKIGAAYQIYDDCLDIAGNETEIGKTLGTDLRKGKMTLPILMLLRSAPAGERERYCELILSENAGAITELLKTEAPNGALRSSLDAGEESLRDAQAELQAVPSNPFTDSLFQLGDALREMLDQFRV
jgi:octaprenyl-diphosphate synthase